MCRLEFVPPAKAAAIPWLTVAQMREVDRVAVSHGLSLVQMMENAGAALAAVAAAMVDWHLDDRRFVVLVGPGGNGAGGLVAARRLHGWGATGEVRLSHEPETLARVTTRQLRLTWGSGVSVRAGAARLRGPDLFLDAILGYGQQGAPRSQVEALIAATADSRVLALDVPTGLELESGTVPSMATTAQATMTLALPKLGLRSSPARPHAGEVLLADIGIPAVVYRKLGIAYRTPFRRGPIVALPTCTDHERSR